MDEDMGESLARVDDPNAEFMATNLAQVVTCGRWSLAFGFGWANLIVEHFELVTIPRAADWLIGAVNIDGAIVPVVDLSVFFDSDAKAAPADRHNRLLLGGRVDGNHESALALLFSGLPSQIEYTPEPLDAHLEIPERLREMCSGIARSSSGQAHFEIRTDRLIEFLTMNLAEF